MSTELETKTTIARVFCTPEFLNDNNVYFGSRQITRIVPTKGGFSVFVDDGTDIPYYNVGGSATVDYTPKLTPELETAFARIRELEAENKKLQTYNDILKAERDAARARVDVLEKALQPFADAAQGTAHESGALPLFIRYGDGDMFINYQPLSIAHKDLTLRDLWHASNVFWGDAAEKDISTAPASVTTVDSGKDERTDLIATAKNFGLENNLFLAAFIDTLEYRVRRLESAMPEVDGK